MDIEKGLACDRDYMRLTHFELLGILETEGSSVSSNRKQSAEARTIGADRNFGTNTSSFLPSASSSTRVMSPSPSTFTLTRRPVRLSIFVQLRFSYPSQASKAFSALALSTRKSAMA